jgi:HEAT repeat protein
LAWSWRGELPLTAQHVDGLIDQIMTSPASDHSNRERAMLLGVSGDRRAVPALLRLINDPPADCGARDTRIAALRALGRLQAVETRQVCLTIAETDTDPGTRITAVRALLDLGFEDAPVEAAAKAYVREVLLPFGNLPEQDEDPTLKRWIEEAKQSIPG